jgi:hypothetical protein
MDHGQEISEGLDPSPGLSEADREDIRGLHGIYMTGKRASWQLAISPFTYREVTGTSEPGRRHYLESWFFEIWAYWQELIRCSDDLPTFIEAEATRVRLLSSGQLDILPHIADRILLIDAIVYRCDLFCTRDRKTIIRHRDDLSHLPIVIVSPAEWWGMIQPFSALWW